MGECYNRQARSVNQKCRRPCPLDIATTWNAITLGTNRSFWQILPMNTRGWLTLSWPAHYESGVLECYRKNGDRVRFDAKTNEFGVFSTQGFILTYMIVQAAQRAPNATLNIFGRIVNDIVTHVYICPVCGYDKLADTPSNFTICPSCGTELYDDAFASRAELRAAWLRNGAKWWSSVDKQPENWDPYLQVNVAIEVSLIWSAIFSVFNNNQPTSGVRVHASPSQYHTIFSVDEQSIEVDGYLFDIYIAELAPASSTPFWKSISSKVVGTLANEYLLRPDRKNFKVRCLAEWVQGVNLALEQLRGQALSRSIPCHAAWRPLWSVVPVFPSMSDKEKIVVVLWRDLHGLDGHPKLGLIIIEHTEYGTPNRGCLLSPHSPAGMRSQFFGLFIYRTPPLRSVSQPCGSKFGTRVKRIIVLKLSPTRRTNRKVRWSVGELVVSTNWADVHPRMGYDIIYNSTENIQVALGAR